MKSIKIYGTIKEVDAPNVEKNLQSFLLEVKTTKDYAYFPMTCFERALTQDNMGQVAVGNDVTVECYLNSRESKSQAGNTYYRLSLSVIKIEKGNTTGEEEPQQAPKQTSVVFAGGETSSAQVVEDTLPF